MPSAVAGPEIERLIQLLARLPGLGPRSARRAALHLIKKRELLMAPLAAALETAMEKIEICKVCGNIEHRIVHGLYDTRAMSSLSAPMLPIFGARTPTRSTDAITWAVRCRRSMSRPGSRSTRCLRTRNEVILALNATVDGQATPYHRTVADARGVPRPGPWRASWRARLS